MAESYSSILCKYLVKAFPESGIKQDKGSWLKFDNTDTLLYVNGSKKHDTGDGWYDLDESVYNSLMSARISYQAIVLGEPDTAFVLSKKFIQDVFGSQSKQVKEGNRWMFTINLKDSRYFLVFTGKAKYDITEYLNNWDMIPEFGNSNNHANDFEILRNYLLNKMKMEANYQPVMIKTLLENDGSASRSQISEKIKEFNNHNAGARFEQDFRFVPVYEVLEKNGITRKENDRYILIPSEITPDQRKELIVLCNSKIKEFAKEPYLFVTGYDQKNLEISIQKGILGWVNNSNFLSVGSLVFVFNKDSLVLETCFEITSQSNDKNLIWADEREMGKIIYGNRWNATVLFRDLDIPLNTINSITPFNKEKFQGLLRGNFPMPLDTPSNYNKYTQFRNMLLDHILTASNNWIFVVTDQDSFKGEEVYRIRMEQKFWGLNERTSHRKHLKKGDRVIFSYGARTFLGTATLDSNSFQLNEAQKNQFQHDIFKTDYGVLLSDIVSWKEPKKIQDYIDNISFITNKQQYPVYFQGGIKKISNQDFTNIVEDMKYQSPDADINNSEEFEDEPLEFPLQVRIDSAIEKIARRLLIDKNIVIQMLISLLAGRHVILAGPVGTGKTTLARLVGELFWQSEGHHGYHSEIYTATAEWSSHDVIGGMVPRLKNDEPTYEIVLGCVSETVVNNWSPSRKNRVHTIHGSEKFKGTWLIIDEFNRADIDKVFGQLFTSLEIRVLRIPVIQGSKIFEDVKIPLDYRIICTLNTADRHYLFKLSDALKRRFAYIELFPPTRKEREKEIYYALSNGLNELAFDFSKLIVLNSDLKTIDSEKTDSRLLSAINLAYDIFDVTRMVKPLGTAVLKSIYQSLLVGVKLTVDYDNSLDTAINSNLIPQLESINLTSLESLFHFLFRNPVDFFKEKHGGNDRDQYQNDFKNFLNFINSNKEEVLSKQFLEKIEDSIWDSLKNSYEQYKKDINCPLFRTTLQDMMKVSLI